MMRIKTVLLICGVAVFVIVTGSLVRAIAAPAPWEQSWPAATVQNQSGSLQQSTVVADKSTPAPAQSATSSPSPDQAQVASSTQSSASAKPDVLAVAPPADTNQAASIQPVSPPPALPAQATVTQANPGYPGFWCQPMNQNFRPPYSWYSTGGMMSGWRGGRQ